MFKKGHIPWNKKLKGFVHLRSFKKGHGTSNTGRTWFKKGMVSAFKGRHHSKEANKKNKEKHLGSIPWNKDKKGIYSKETIERMRKLASGINSSVWQGGISFEPYSIDWTETLRRSIRERDNYICQLCSQYGNVIHHIDYNKKNCNPDNLITLCKRCNSKVNFNRKYWIDYFKFYF